LLRCTKLENLIIQGGLWGFLFVQILGEVMGGVDFSGFAALMAQEGLDVA
jgi:hypothetical protein